MKRVLVAVLVLLLTLPGAASASSTDMDFGLLTGTMSVGQTGGCNPGGAGLGLISFNTQAHYRFSTVATLFIHGPADLDICGRLGPTISNIIPLGAACLFSKSTDGTGSMSTFGSVWKAPVAYGLSNIRWKFGFPAAPSGQTVLMFADYATSSSTGTLVALFQMQGGAACAAGTARDMAVVGALAAIPSLSFNENAFPVLCKRSGDASCIFGSK